MNNNTESERRRQVEELRAEVRRLRNLIELGLAIVGIAGALVLSSMAGLAILIGLSILLGIMASPFRHLIFSTLFSTPENNQRDI